MYKMYLLLSLFARDVGFAYLHVTLTSYLANLLAFDKHHFRLHPCLPAHPNHDIVNLPLLSIPQNPMTWAYSEFIPHSLLLSLMQKVDLLLPWMLRPLNNTFGRRQPKLEVLFHHPVLISLQTISTLLSVVPRPAC